MAIHINIGSNTGDSATLIAEAVRRIGALLPERTMRVSEPYRSRAWGYESEHEYMNVGVMFEGRGVPTPSDARAFLGRLQGIEKALGQRRRHLPRPRSRHRHNRHRRDGAGYAGPYSSASAHASAEIRPGADSGDRSRMDSPGPEDDSGRINRTDMKGTRRNLAVAG